MHSYRKMLEWKPEDPSIETVVVTTWEKCGEGQEPYELLVHALQAHEVAGECSRDVNGALTLSGICRIAPSAGTPF